jgi:hypothetical protein
MCGQRKRIENVETWMVSVNYYLAAPLTWFERLL